MIYDDWKSQYPLSGDTIANKYGEILADNCADHCFTILGSLHTTFVSAERSSSVIDLSSTKRCCSDLICNAYGIEDNELFSGAPLQG